METLEARHGAKDVVQSKVGVMSIVGMFYAICCAGAFGIEEMIPECGPGLTIVILLVLPLVWAVPYSLICAEMGSARPVEGGSLMWVKEALGEFWFAIMVFCNVIWSLVCNTVYVVLAIGYLGKIVPLSDTMSYALKILMILIFFTINVLGVKDVSIVSTVLSILIVIAFAVVAVVGFMNMNQSPMQPFFSDEYDTAFQHVGAGLAIGIWMYSGFDELSVIAGEVQDAHKIIPKALMIVVPLIALTYILPTMAGLGSVGEWADWTTEPDGVGYSAVLYQFIGPAAGVGFMIIAIIGQASIFNVCLTTGSRCVLMLADEHFGPRFVANLTKKRGVPYVGLIVVAVVTMALVPFSFTFLVVVDVFFMVMVTSLTVIACMKLKREIPPEEVPFKIPGGKTVHTVCSLLVLIICVMSTLVNGMDYFLGGMIWILFVPILYVLAKWKFKGSTINEPDLYPINPKTHLGFGDVKKLGGLYAGIGVFAIFAKFFINWNEGDWGPEYYLDTYGSGLFSDFGQMQTVTVIIGIVCIVAGLIIYLVGRKTN
ncbi:MAG: APC family permease [Clostridia bacterium]|nr:APC family permease [Clostridia bacterium]